MTAHFSARDGARLAYRDEGRGMPVLCLAGLTRPMADFDDLAPHLADLRLIRMDCRGRGESAWTGAASYTPVQEAEDALALLDHLGVARAAVIGTSRGGLIGLVLAATARARILGLCLNDIGPVIERPGLERIAAYVGRRPAARDHAAMALRLAAGNPGFDGVTSSRWQLEAERHYRLGARGLEIRYDPALREAFLAGLAAPAADLWPLFDAAAGLPLAAIRGANSDILSPATLAEMARRRPDMVCATVPDRGHAPFLDETESLAAIRAWLAGIAA